MYWLLLTAVFFSEPTTLLIPPFKHDFGFHRTSKFLLNMFLGPNFQIDDPEGIVAVKMKETINPKNPTDDGILTLFALNSGASQIIYNSGMTRIGIFGKTGNGKNEFSHPQSITVNEDGDIYVTDTDNNRLVKLKYLKGKLTWDKVLIDNLNAPAGVAIDSKRRIYVTEPGNSRIIVLDSLGKILFTRQKDLVNPTSIAVIDQDDSWNHYQDNFIVVVDNMDQRISQFDINGKLLNTIDARTIGLSHADFGNMAIDYYANIYVTDRANHQIHKFDRNLNYIISFGKEGTGDNQFESPRGITIGRHFGQVFISEEEGGQYYWLGLDGYLVECSKEIFTEEQPGTSIALYLTELAQVKVLIYNEQNKIVRFLIQEPKQTGETFIVWDGRSQEGNIVLPGNYKIKLEIRPTHNASQRYFKKELETLVSCSKSSVESTLQGSRYPIREVKVN
jgi:outer membrane protein assembly factor BamB